MIKVLKERNMKKYGYVIKDIEYSGEDSYGIDPFVMKSAFTSEGWYIGDTKTAINICKKKGIKPQLIEEDDSDNNVCSIGFQEEEQKWYGWSHRAMYGFGIGSTCKKGDCHFIPSNKEEFIEDCKQFYSDEYKTFEKVEEKENGIDLHFKYVETLPNKSLRGEIVIFECVYPEKWGRGEWTAETLEDAKQMAIDFAKGVR